MKLQTDAPVIIQDGGPRPATARTFVLCFALFFSGIGALIFETLWLRLSGLAFGNSVWAAALILSSFMAGLAIGNAIAASSRVRRWRPLYFYAALEFTVAVLGCTIVFLLPLLGTVLRPLWHTLWNYQPTLLGLRFIVSFLILLLPTTAMGLTLPVLVEDPVLQRSNFGRVIGLFYGCNTLGAVTGALIGEGFLISAFGLYGTGFAAAGSCLAAAVTAALVARRKDIRAAAKEPTGAIRFALAYRPPWRLLVVSFGTGCILLALEVIWFRFLRLYVASTATTFSMLLAVVLAGIALGSVAYGALHRSRRQSSHLLPLLLLGAALATLACYIFFPGDVVKAAAGPFNLATWPQVALLSFALMFPVSFISGILFPAVAARVQSTVDDRMNSTGITTLFNTTGAAAGPLLASFIVLPVCGFQTGLILSAVAYAVLAFVVINRASWRSSAFMSVLVVLSAVLAAVVIAFPRALAKKHFAHAALPYEADEQGHRFATVIKTREGPADTYQLLRRDLFGQPYYYRLLTNAFSMSATNPRSQRYMRLFAYLPLALRDNSEDVLLICYGCGVTADAFLHGSRVKRVDIVDISKEVFELADEYVGINYTNPLRDGRVHNVVQDGRFSLQATPGQYDVISGEPPPPKTAGAVNLYTEEFFSLLRDRLRDGGIATFWLPINQLRVEEVKSILRAFHNAFPNASVWGAPDQEWIMMGIKGEPQPASAEQIRRLWEDANSAADLQRIGVEVPQQLAALFLMDGDEIDRLTNSAAPLTDAFPKRLSDANWDDQASHALAAKYMEGAAAWQRFTWSPTFAKLWPESLSQSLESFFLVREGQYLSSTTGSNKLAELDLYLRRSRLRTPVLEVLGSDEFRLQLAANAAGGSAEPSFETIPDLTAGALARRDIPEAIQLLEKQRGAGAASLNDTFLLIYLYCVNGSVDKAEQLAAASASAIQKDWFVDWLWQKLQSDFGFRPPA